VNIVILSGLSIISYIVSTRKTGLQYLSMVYTSLATNVV